MQEVVCSLCSPMKHKEGCRGGSGECDLLTVTPETTLHQQLMLAFWSVNI